MNHDNSQKIKGLVPAGKRKNNTRFVVVHEYHGNQSMQSAFRQVIENRVSDQFELWMEKKLNTRR